MTRIVRSLAMRRSTSGRGYRSSLPRQRFTDNVCDVGASPRSRLRARIGVAKSSQAATKGARAGAPCSVIEARHQVRETFDADADTGTSIDLLGKLLGSASGATSTTGFSALECI